MKIGQQLFSLRSLCDTPENLDKCLELVHNMGYSCVQLSGICKADPEALKAMLAKHQLEAPVCHVKAEDLRDNPQDLLDYYEAVGCPNIGLGILPKEIHNNATGVRQFLKDLEPSLDLLKKNGKRLVYHHHGFEFAPTVDTKERIFDIIVNETDFSLLLDTYWLQMGCLNPAETIKKLAHRTKIVHFKDWFVSWHSPQFAPVGSGMLDWDAIYEACLEAGIEYAFVEQDKTYDEQLPLEAAQASYDFMHKKGWV